jgi:very-short-patch-repair endonuclease
MNATEIARALRVKQTPFEALFWNKVRSRKTGFKFVRQKPIRFSINGKNHTFYADFTVLKRKRS